VPDYHETILKPGGFLCLVSGIAIILGL
jgi:hypothetical protein